jgi:hypothetical protein
MGLTSATKSAKFAFLSSMADSFRLFTAYPVLCSAISAPLNRMIDNSSGGSAPWPGDSDLQEFISEFRSFALSFFSSNGVNSPMFPYNSSIFDDHSSFPRSASDLITAKPKLQHRLSMLQAEMSFAKLLPLVHPASKARLLSQRHRGALAVYDMIPSCDDLTVSNDAFRFMAWHTQCFSDNPQFGPMFRCACQTVALSTRRDRHSDSLLPNHEDHCHAAKGGPLTVRHDTICSTFVKCLRSTKDALVHPCFQKNQALLNSISQHDVPDIDVINFPRVGQKAFVEVSLISPFQKRFHNSSQLEPLLAAKTRQKEKEAKYIAYSNSQQHQLFAVVIETTGAFSPGVEKFLSVCAANMDPVSFDLDAEKRTWLSDSFKRFWTQAISASYWRAAYDCGRRLLENGGSISLSLPTRAVSSEIRDLSRPVIVPAVPSESRDLSQPPVSEAGPVAISPSSDDVALQSIIDSIRSPNFILEDHPPLSPLQAVLASPDIQLVSPASMATC